MSPGTGRASAALRLAGALAVLALFFIAHGVQCAAASPSVHAGAGIDHVVVVGMLDGVASHDEAAFSAGPQPAAPAHSAGHAVAVCFAVIAAAIALLFSRRLLQSFAGLAQPAQRHLAAAWSTAERWRANAPPLSVLCVSRT